MSKKKNNCPRLAHSFFLHSQLFLSFENGPSEDSKKKITYGQDSYYFDPTSDLNSWVDGGKNTKDSI